MWEYAKVFKIKILDFAILIIWMGEDDNNIFSKYFVSNWYRYEIRYIDTDTKQDWLLQNIKSLVSLNVIPAAQF